MSNRIRINGAENVEKKLSSVDGNVPKPEKTFWCDVLRSNSITPGVRGRRVAGSAAATRWTRWRSCAERFSKCPRLNVVQRSPLVVCFSWTVHTEHSGEIGSCESRDLSVNCQADMKLPVLTAFLISLFAELKNGYPLTYSVKLDAVICQMNSGVVMGRRNSIRFTEPTTLRYIYMRPFTIGSFPKLLTITRSKIIQP
jgi:hypothetical protein